MKKLLLAIPVVAAIAYGGTKFYVQHRAAETVDQAIAMLAPVARISYDAVASTMTGELSITEVSIVPAGYSDVLEIGSIGMKLPSFLDLVSLDELGRSGEIPDSMELFVDGVRVDVRHDYMAEFFLESEREVAARFDGEVPTREEDPRGYCVNRYGVSVRDMSEFDLDVFEFSLRFGLRQLVNEFAFDMTFDIEDLQTVAITARFLGDLEDLPRGRITRPELTGFELISEDHSSMQRSLARCEALGVDPEEAKALMVSDVLSALEEAGFVADERLIEPLRAGIMGEHTWFRVIGTPERPVDLTRLKLYKPEDLPALLGVDLESR